MTTHAEFNAETEGSVVAQAFSDQIKGKNVLVTGVGPDGIGRTTAINIASQNPSLLIISGRSKEKLTSVESEIKALYPSANVRVLLVDLSSQISVRNAAHEVNNYPESINVLINNAGVMAIPERTVSEDGIEMHFATNHIGHFLFTNLILGKIKAAAEKNPPGSTRIINVSSAGVRFSRIRFSDWNFEGKPLAVNERTNWEVLKTIGEKETDGYNGWVAYGQSKTANVLFSEYLNRHLSKYGIVSLALHPGTIYTALTRYMHQETFDRLKPIWELRKFKSQDQGSSTTLVAAFDPKLDGKSGLWLSDNQLAVVAEYAIDPEEADKLWKLSEQIVNQHFGL